MNTLSIPIQQLIAHNLSIIAMYTFSREPLRKLMESGTEGELKRVYATVFDVAAPIAERAWLELAVLFRYLDDEEGGGLSGYLGTTEHKFGKLIKPDRSEVPLQPREVANKIIHARSFDLNVVRDGRPTLICHARSPDEGDGEPRPRRREEEWLAAEIDVGTLIMALGAMATG